MANLKSVQAAGAAFYTIPSANAQTDLIPIVGDYVTVAAVATGDIIEMCPLPAGYVPVDVIVDTESLAGTTATADVGILSGNWAASGTRTMGAEFMTGKAFATAGIYRMDVAGGGRVAPTTNDRSIGVKLSTVTAVVAARKIRVTVMCRPQVEGV